MQGGIAVTVGFLDHNRLNRWGTGEPGLHPTRITAPAVPIRPSIARRFKLRSVMIRYQIDDHTDQIRSTDRC